MAEYDIVVDNGIVLSLDKDFSVFNRGRVCIRDSVIRRIEPVEGNAVLPKAGRVIDADGGIVMPGLVNTHTHLPMTLFRGMADDLDLHVWLNDYIFPSESMHVNPETVKTASLLACAEMLLSGTTTCCDGYFYENEVAEAVLLSGMRGVLGHGIIDFPAPGVPDPSQNVDCAVSFVEKWKTASSLISPSIFCHSPYTCSKETIRKAKQAAEKYGVLFQIHVAETRKEREQMLAEQKVTPVGWLESLGVLGARTLLVHCIWVDESDIERIARFGAGISVTTESEMKLASGIAPVPRFLSAGIKTGLGTDGSASNNDLDMFSELDFTAKLHKVHILDPTVMSAKTVLKLATIQAAESMGLGGVIGSLEEGKQADLVVADIKHPRLTPLYDPVSHVVYAVNGSDVRDVIVGGKLVVENRTILTFEVGEVMEKMEEIAKNISPGKKGI